MISENLVKLFRQQITVIMKPTANCNLRCVYCYNDKHSGCDNIKYMSMENYEKLLDMLCQEYKKIQFVWVGGEPLLYGLDNYRKVVELQEKYSQKYQTTIINGMQSNGLLLSDEFKIFLNEQNFSISVSYDGIANNLTRGYPSQTFMKLQEQYKLNGVLHVLNNHNIVHIIEDYKEYNDKGINVKFNTVFELEKEKTLEINNVEFCHQIGNFLDFWFSDENCKISISPYEDYIKILTNQPCYPCTMGSCLYKFLTMDQNGFLYPCSKSLPNEYICHINDVSTIAEVFSQTSYNKLISDVLSRQNKCREKCELFYYCGGGCHFRGLHGLECDSFKFVFKTCQKWIKNRRYEIKNPIIKNLIKNVQKL